MAVPGKREKLEKALSENVISFIKQGANKGLQINFTILFAWNIKFHRFHSTSDKDHVLECFRMPFQMV